MADETNPVIENPTTDPAPTNDQPNPTADPASSTTPNPADDDEGIDLGKGGDDDKSTDQTGGDDKGDDDKPAANAELFGAPAEGEAYAIEGLPEGMAIDEAALEAATPIFRELGLSNAGASKIAGVYAEKVLPGVVETAKTQFEDNLKAGIDAQRTEWQGETVKAVKGEIELKTATGDKISFDGAGMKQVSQAAARAIDRLAPAGFREFLETTGLGVHPAMVAFAYCAGQLVAEDTDAGGGGGPVGEKPSRTQKYYGR